MLQNNEFLASVRQQYEDFPYPPRDPENELVELFCTYMECLDILNFYGFEGRQDFKNDFRCLIAGGGTGDSTIYLAEQLKHTDATIIHIDLSTASIRVAQERARKRALTNIRWLNASLLDLASLDLGTFDYINCYGVLHHLADPEAGLSSLASVLKPDGVMGLMLYGKYGRTGIYPMQNILRAINADVASPRRRLENARILVDAVPETNWLRKNENLWCAPELDDEELYDRLLHSQDQAYNVLDLDRFLASSMLEIQQFMLIRGEAKRVYDPGTYLKNQLLLEKIRQLPLVRQQWIAEVINGSIHKHEFFTGFGHKKLPSPRDLDFVPYYYFHFHYEGIYQDMAQQVRDQSIRAAGKVTFSHSSTGDSIELELRPLTSYLFKYLDGNTSIGDLLNCVRLDPDLSDELPREEDILNEFERIYDLLHIHDWMLLRHKSVPLFKSPAQLQQDFRERLKNIPG